MARRVCGAATTLLVLFCAQVDIGVATPVPTTGPTGVGAQNFSTVVPSSVPPSCRGENVSLRVEASDEAKRDLSGWLAKDTIRLIFIYFDLVVGNHTYHPGSCPNDGRTAIDAQTPLAWVLTSGGPSGSGDIGSHSFARSYLTLPVSYPRLYSMGILEDRFVARMRHEVYGMKVVVNNTTTVDGKSCWNELKKAEKASLMLEVVQDFVRNHDRLDNTTSWSMCYTDPTNEDLPFSTSLLIPHTPMYKCQDGNGPMRRLERDSSLKGFFVLFVILSFVAVALQSYTLTSLMGSTGSSLEILDPEIYAPSDFNYRDVYDRTFFFPGPHITFHEPSIPAHLTVKGLLCSDPFFGRKVFYRVVILMSIVTVLFIFAAWPNLLVHLILTPASPLASVGVSSSETFGQNWPCQPHMPTDPSLSLVSTWIYCVGCPLLIVLYVVIFSLNNELYFFNRVKEFSTESMQQLSSIFLTALGFIRVMLSLPVSRSCFSADTEDYSWCHFIWRLTFGLLLWIPLFPIMALVVTICLIGEIFEFTGLRQLLCLFSQPLGDRYPAHTCPRLSHILSCFFEWLIALLQVVFLYIQGSELLTFVLLSSISLYITYPIQTFLVVSWSIALVAEALKIFADYRAPLLTIQEAFAKKCLSLMKEHFKLLDYAGCKHTFCVEYIHSLFGVLSFPRDTFCRDRPAKFSATDLSQMLAVEQERILHQKMANFFHHFKAVWEGVCLALLDPHEPFEELQLNEQRYPLGSGKPTFLTFVLEWLRVRERITRCDEVGERLKSVLWMRLFHGMVKFVVLVVTFLSVILLLLAFDSLWTGTNPNHTNALFLTILVVPMYTFVRTKLSSPSVTESDKLLIETRLDLELTQCYKNAFEGTIPVCNLIIDYRHINSYLWGLGSSMVRALDC